MLVRWQSTIVDERGNIMPGAILTIRRESDQTLVRIYRDRDAQQPYPVGQVTADANGFAYFYAAPDLYRITSVLPVIDWRDVNVGFQSLQMASVTYLTYADMLEDESRPVPTTGQVVDDSDTAKNGFYVWDGASWQRSSIQPATIPDMEAAMAQAVDEATQEAENYRDEAAISADQARSAAESSGPRRLYDTYADALADLSNIPDGMPVEIFSDETHSGGHTLYINESGTLVHKIDFDALEGELAKQTGANMVGAPTNQFLDEAVTHFDSIADLRAIRPQGLRAGKTVVVTVSCHTVEGDGGGGRFRWQYNSNQTDDNGTVIGSGDPGRWVRIIEGPVYAEWFGARAFAPKVDDPSGYDSTAAFQAASDYAGRGGSWLWRGVHRITATVNIPSQQTFGSFGKVTSFNPGKMADWDGMNGPLMTRVDHGVFFDPPSKTGVLFECQEGAEPHDFHAYGDAYKTLGANYTLAPLEAEFNVVHAFKFPKYIKLRDVSIACFHTAFYSVGDGVNQGNYYSSYTDFEVMRCFRVFRYSTTDPYNQRLYNPRIANNTQFMECDAGIRNMTIHGGAIENWRQFSAIRGSGSLAIFGTYFETTVNDTPGGLGSLFYITSAVHFTFSYYGGMCYVNHINQFVRADSNNVTINSNGNTFMRAESGSTATSTQIYYTGASYQATADGSLTGDRFYGSATGVSYTNHFNFSTLAAPTALVASAGLRVLRSESQNGFSLKPLSAAPASPQSGCIYLANGGTWNPLSRSGGYAYFVCWRGGWEAM